MTDKLSLTQLEMLRHLATYQLLTAEQVALLRAVTLRGARKGLVKLDGMGMVEARYQAYGQARGRPAKAYSLSPKGIRCLKSRDPNLENVVLAPWDDGAGPAHQLLLNWFLLHVLHVPRAHPQLQVQILSGLHHPTMESAENPGGPTEMIPDAVFAMSCEEQDKTLLFFVEVDMGTESLTSPSRASRDFREKILRYQDHFRAAAYKRYEAPLGCGLRGFRLLVVTNSPRRLASLCRLVQQTPPSDFIWLTDQASMFANGLSAAIWVRGGRQEMATQSMLGPTYGRVAPLLPTRV